MTRETRQGDGRFCTDNDRPMSLAIADDREVTSTWSQRALVRAVAIADLLRVGRGRRATTLGVRVGLLVAGTLVIASCVAVMLWNNLGAGPLDVFIVGLRKHTGLPLAFALWITVGALTLLAWALGRR